MISRTEFEQGVSPENIRASQIIHVALALGVTMFFGIVVFLYGQPLADSSTDEGLIQALCAVLLMFAVGAYGTAAVLYKKMVANITLPERVATADGKVFDKVGDILVFKLRTPQIVRLALFEGVAFFGLVICMLAVQSGLIHAKPVYWAAALPALFVVLLVALTFPTKEKMVAAFEEYQEMSGGR